MVRPKNRWVVFFALAASLVSARSSIGSSNFAKSTKVFVLGPRLDFKTSAKVMEYRDLDTSPGWWGCLWGVWGMRRNGRRGEWAMGGGAKNSARRGLNFSLRLVRGF